MGKSSPRSVAPLHLDPRPSPLLRRLLLLMYLGAMVLSLPLPLGWPWHLLLPLALLWHGRIVWRRTARQPSLSWDANGLWWLHGDEGDRSLQLMADSVLWPGLVVLLFRAEDRRRCLSVVLLPDSLARVTWRRLRAALRQSRGR